MPQFSPQWIALCREAAISGQSISAGLAALRKANYAETGRYSHAFFSLSIGLERLLKLIFLIDHANRNIGVFPTEADLRNKFGHDLDKLFTHAELVHMRLPNTNGRYELDSDGLEREILKFLTKFAKSTRYYNLNFLVGGATARTMADPIAEWFGSIGSKILAKHYTARRQAQDAHSAALLQRIAGQYALVRHTAEDGSELNDLESASLQTGRNKIVQKYGTFYCARLIRFLYMVLYDLVHESYTVQLDIPQLDEFFFPFLNDDNYLLTLKTFPPRGQ